MATYCNWQIKDAIKTIKAGFDGSPTNEYSLTIARNLLIKASNDLEKFASKKCGIVAHVCNEKAQEYLDLANEAKRLIK